MFFRTIEVINAFCKIRDKLQTQLALYVCAVIINLLLIFYSSLNVITTRPVDKPVKRQQLKRYSNEVVAHRKTTPHHAFYWSLFPYRPRQFYLTVCLFLKEQ